MARTYPRSPVEALIRILMSVCSRNRDTDVSEGENDPEATQGPREDAEQTASGWGTTTTQRVTGWETDPTAGWDNFQPTTGWGRNDPDVAVGPNPREVPSERRKGETEFLLEVCIGFLVLVFSFADRHQFNRMPTGSDIHLVISDWTALLFFLSAWMPFVACWACKLYKILLDDL